MVTNLDDITSGNLKMRKARELTSSEMGLNYGSCVRKCSNPNRKVIKETQQLGYRKICERIYKELYHCEFSSFHCGDLTPTIRIQSHMRFWMTQSYATCTYRELEMVSQLPLRFEKDCNLN